MYLILLSSSNGCLKVRILKMNCLKMVYSPVVQCVKRSHFFRVPLRSRSLSKKGVALPHRSFRKKGVALPHRYFIKRVHSLITLFLKKNEVVFFLTST